MKRITEILFAVAVGLDSSSCVEEVIQPAEPENDSYGVYFETLSAAQKKVEFDPAEEAVLNFKAMRTAEDDAITVPVVVTATAATSGGNVDASDIFTVSNISFKDGQKETVFSVSFPKAELECNIIAVSSARILNMSISILTSRHRSHSLLPG